jgi:hypothetical protein
MRLAQAAGAAQDWQHPQFAQQLVNDLNAFGKILSQTKEHLPPALQHAL